MKLLFGHGTNNADEEVKALIGHIDSDIEFENLKTDIKSATRQIIKIIGKPVYDAAVTLYEAGTPSTDNLELIDCIRLPIALDAIESNANSSDVSHSNNGRRIRIDDYNKVPFQWMLDRDNENLERKYYRAIDELIEYLDETNTVWKSSDAYKQSQRYFVRSVSDFDDRFPIESRLLMLKMQPAFKRCERRYILPRVNETVYAAIKAKQEAGTPLTGDENDLVELIKDACIYFALAWSMKVLRVTLFPEGVLQSYISDRTSTTSRKVSEKMETELAAQQFNEQFLESLHDIEKLQTKNNPNTITNEMRCEITRPSYGFDDEDAFVSL